MIPRSSASCTFNNYRISLWCRNTDLRFQKYSYEISLSNGSLSCKLRLMWKSRCMLVCPQSCSVHGVYGRRKEAGSSVVWPAQWRYSSLSELHTVWSAEWSGKPSTASHRFVTLLDCCVLLISTWTSLGHVPSLCLYQRIANTVCSCNSHQFDVKN